LVHFFVDGSSNAGLVDAPLVRSCFERCPLVSGVACRALAWHETGLSRRKPGALNHMPTHLARFEMPKHLVKDEETATETYACFTAEPFENGYGHTVGNSLRRVLLASLEGASITSVRITGADHEFTSLPGVVEDVTEIILNLKKVKFRHFDRKEPATLSISVDREGPVTAADIQESTQYEVVNKDQLICTLDRKTKFEADLEVRVGRGFNTQ